MKQANHRMIILARESRELSQSGLCRLTGIVQGTLSKIEGGLSPCPENVLEKIAKILEYPKEFFFSDESVHGIGTEAHHCLYRRKSAVPVKTLKRIEAEVNIKRMNTAKMLNSIEMHPELEIPYFDPSEFGNDIEQIAKSVRAYWNLPSGPIDNVIDLIERAGGIVIPHNFGSEKVDATSLKIEGLPPLFFVNTLMSGDRLRFTLAHELGHVVMHTVPHPKIEEEADRFAAEFLMPAADIGPSLSRLDLAKAARLKPFWKVSMAAIIYRAHSLGRIDANQYRYLFYQLSVNNYKTREPAHLDIPREASTVQGAMLDYFREELSYSPEDLRGLFQINEMDFQKYYGVQNSGPKLYAVK